MSPEIEHLISLQVTDREIQRLRAEVAELPKRVAAIEEKLAGTKSGLEKAKASVKADEAARRTYDSAISDLRQKISKYRDQSLEVKTNDQYKALMHEIQFAEQQIAANEDKILEFMVNAEVRDKQVKAAEAEMKAEIAASHAWFYRHEFGESGEVFLSYSNHDGRASRRIYDAATGRRLGDILMREGQYRQAFPEDLSDAVRLNGNWSDSEQDGWENELPTRVLDALQRDLHLARAEAAAHREK